MKKQVENLVNNSNVQGAIQYLSTVSSVLNEKWNGTEKKGERIKVWSVQLFFWFDQGMIVKKTLIQTLACHLSSTLMQLLFSFDQDTGVEKHLIKIFAAQLQSTLM